MSEIIKRLVYTSVGVASITNEKFKELIEDLIQNQHYTEDEGKRIIDTFLFDLRVELDKITGNIHQKVESILNKYGISDMNTLKEEVEEYIEDVKQNPILLLRLPSKK
ncbi:MAG: hypothetical protein R2739_09615 [Chitinophagales bacterium]|nr:hypothetical protein [Bacteroidota bacterium]